MVFNKFPAAAAAIGHPEQNIAVEDEDGYEILSDLEFRHYCNCKEEPCFVIITNLFDGNVTGASNSSTSVTTTTTETNTASIVCGTISVAINEAGLSLEDQIENIIVPTEEIDDHVADLQRVDKPKVLFCSLNMLSYKTLACL